MLEFKVSGQTLTRTDSFRPAEKSRGYLTAKFDLLSGEWMSGTLMARAKNRQDTTVYEAEIINGQCLIPWEALVKNGVVQISVFLKNGDVEITTNFVDVGISGTLPGGSESNPPTPSELDQIKEQIGDLTERLEDLEQNGGGGGEGKDGGYYTPSVTQAGEAIMAVRFTPSKADMPQVPEAKIVLPAGPQGPSGAAGKTPEKGVDYFTDADKTEIINAVLANFTDVSEVGA